MKDRLISLNSVIAPIGITVIAGIVTTVIVAAFDLTNPDSTQSIVDSLSVGIRKVLPWIGWFLAASVIGQKYWSSIRRKPVSTANKSIVVTRGDVNWRYAGSNWTGIQVSGPECPDDATPLMVKSAGGLLTTEGDLSTATDFYVIGDGKTSDVLHCPECQKDYPWNPAASVSQMRAEAITLVRGELNRRKS